MAEYCQGCINSERCLQAIMYGKIRKHLPGCNVFVEPTIHINESRIRPDIILCDNEGISAVFELKFVPHCYALVEPDLNKLNKIASLKSGEFNLEINPVNGRFANKKHKITQATELHFVVISQEDARAVYRGDIVEYLSENAERRFALWFARINNDKRPDYGIEFSV